ncbi:MAG: GlsB/YeaQ/YmgE family stress response membrane protein [Solirubrobacteraceae bacterium]
MLSYLVGLLIVGLIVGALARLFVPGPDPMGIGMTILIGVAGSFIAGLLVRAFHGTQGAGFILSVVCAAGLVYAGKRSRSGYIGRGALDRRGLPPRRRYW